jgi:hypothetical protein
VKKMKSENSIKYIFLAYANYPIRDDPNNIDKMFYKDTDLFTYDQLGESGRIKTGSKFKLNIQEEMHEEIIEYFKKLSKCTPQTIEKLRPKPKKKEAIFLELYNIKPITQIILDGYDQASINRGLYFKRTLQRFNLAVNALFKYRNGYCESECSERTIRQKIFGEAIFNGENRLKCLECDQLLFINILNKIIEGKEYSEIKELSILKKWAEDTLYRHKTICVSRASNGGCFKEALTETIKFIWKINYDNDDYFRMAVNGFHAYSLIAFLLKDENNREKIRKCPECNTFFIAPKIDPRIKKCHECSRKSRKSKEYNREYAKRYRQVLKAKQNAVEKKAAIKRYMEKAGMTRDEAERVWNIDHPS